MSLYIRLAAILALLAGLWWLHNHIDQGGYDRRVSEEQAALVIAEAQAREVTRLRQRAADHIKDEQDAKYRDIAARLSVALDSLQNRPDRRPDAASDTSTCAGTSGAELSRPDGRFLEGEAARADRIRAALDACYRQYDSLK